MKRKSIGMYDYQWDFIKKHSEKIGHSENSIIRHAVDQLIFKEETLYTQEKKRERR